MRQFEKFHEYLNLNRKDPDYNRFYIAYVYLFFSLSFFSAFIPINYFLLEKHPITYPLAALAPISAGTIYYLFKTRNIDAVSYITAAILATFLFAVALLGEPHASTVTMAVIFPGVVFFLLGHRRGALSFLLFFPVFGLFFWWNTIISAQPVSQVNVAINTILALVLVTIQLFFYELARKEATDEKNELMKHLEIISSRDSLTGLWNRRMSDEFLEQEIARSKRQGNRFSVAIIDIDHFKKTNDTFGHAGGDIVLKEISHEFGDIVRANDRVGRWGGEEFIVICSETGIEDAVVLFNRMRARIEGHAFSNGSQVTASFGIAEYRRSDSPSSLAARADTALYHAKELGRNRVCTQEQAVEGHL